MKKSGILNPQLMNTIASLGHTDTLCIADAGLPIPEQSHRIDLCLVKGIPGFLETLDAVLQETEIESVILAAEVKNQNPGLFSKIKSILGEKIIQFVSHEEFKQQLPLTKGIVRTGECTPYANILLVSGVNF